MTRPVFPIPADHKRAVALSEIVPTTETHLRREAVREAVELVRTTS